jgi:hypothetical protein
MMVRSEQRCPLPTKTKFPDLFPWQMIRVCVGDAVADPTIRAVVPLYPTAWTTDRDL